MNTRRHWLPSVTLTVTTFAITAVGYGQLKSTQYSQPPAVVVETVIVTPSGILPKQIVRPEGPFLLYIENRLPGHVEHFSLTLDQGGGPPELIGLDTNPASWRGAILIDPKPGSYRLRFRGRSDLSLPIQITSK
jgi:hypothetical protein